MSLSLRGEHKLPNIEKDKFGYSGITIVILICEISLAYLGVLLSASSLPIYFRMDISLGLIKYFNGNMFHTFLSGTFLRKRCCDLSKVNEISLTLQ